MTLDRKQSSSFITGSTIYAYTEVDWTITATHFRYDHAGGVNSPYGGWNNNPSATLYWREWDRSAWEWGSWVSYGSGSAHYSGPGDKELVKLTNETFERRSYDREIQLDCDVYATSDTGSGTGSAILQYIVPHLPSTPTNLTATRVSDNQIDLAWTNPSTSYYAFCLEVSIDGGAWSQCWYYNGAGYPTSYSYTAASADHSYRFRCRTEYESAYSAYTSATAAITMTPLPPQSITTAAIQGSTDIAVTLENNSPVATSLVWEVSTDGGSTWSAGSTSPIAGTPVASFTATGISGTAYIRVANANATGTSAWLVSEAVTTICPPAAPTIVAPTGSIVNIADGSMTIEWAFNSLDGSAQTAYEVSLSKNGGAAVTQSGTTAHKLKITFSGITPNSGDTLAFKVRTKGADANWSDWSSTKTVTLYTPPTVTVTSPSATVISMPLSIIASYTDAAGTCKAASYYIAGNGQRYPQEGTLPLTITTSGGATTLSASVPTSAFLPANDAQYAVYITARSSSSLQTSANATFTTAFIEPVAGELNVTNDPETGYVNLTASFADYPDALDGIEWALGSLNVNNGSETTSTTVARTTTVATVQTNTKYEISGDSGFLVNVHYYQAGTWKGNLGAWQSLPYTYDSGQYDGIRLVTKYAGGGDMDLGTIDLTATQDSFTGANLNPFYLKDLNDTTYWFASTNLDTYGTKLADGWAHFEYAAKNINMSPRKWVCPLKASTTYTVMLEVRNATTLTDCMFYVYTGSNSVWQTGSNCEVTGEGAYYLTGTTKADLSLTTITHVRIFVGKDTTSDINVDLRLSLYEGEYSGDFLPYTEYTQAKSISVARVNSDNTITPLIEEGASGSGVVDKYAPLNTSYRYAVTTHAASKAVQTVYVENLLRSDRWFAYWNVATDTGTREEIASAKWNPDNGGIQLARPQRQRVFFAGRSDPVSFDGPAVNLTESPSWLQVEKEDADKFVQLIQDGGRGVYKSCDGWVYHADFELTLNPAYISVGYYGGMSLNITRIAGSRL